MNIRYSISLWNYYHYANSASLERVIESVRSGGWGIELWPSWRDEADLYDPVGRRRVKSALDGMTVSLHTGSVHTLAAHQKQIDAAAELGAPVVVIHPDGLAPEGAKDLDVSFGRDVVAYATGKGVRIALENGPLEFLVRAIDKIDDLGICLDVGHVYFETQPMREFLKRLKHRLIHLHIQDTLPNTESHLPVGKDHYTPGTGGIPREDWELVAATVREIGFDGIAVFEIQPRVPLQTAVLTKRFLETLW